MDFVKNLAGKGNKDNDDDSDRTSKNNVTNPGPQRGGDSMGMGGDTIGQDAGQDEGMGMGQSGMGQSGMGQSGMGQSGMGQSGMGQSGMDSDLSGGGYSGQSMSSSGGYTDQGNMTSSSGRQTMGGNQGKDYQSDLMGSDSQSVDPFFGRTGDNQAADNSGGGRQFGSQTGSGY
ncbi:hypothetical protein [Phaffia rhodozyma]|uniref:Uncharacterized protein n=1 Tax=Phaffia rhodozyma TaxID=264483 RepID=A0A0F7SGT4_PHARH|nr:hypothetical protein [Phaffia rhodozyma]